MSQYQETSSSVYVGRKSEQQRYLHEKISCSPVSKIEEKASEKTIAILGYSCEEGVKRNHGRTGTDQGPDAIRRQLGKLPNHLPPSTNLVDTGTINCIDFNLETAQSELTETISEILAAKAFPIILGGGHDMAYSTYNGLRKHLGSTKTIGIINFDAHFDLRSNEDGNNSGTPFYQIAQDCKTSETRFNYLCLGIRKDANDRVLFNTAKDLEVKYILRDTFRIEFHTEINEWINAFIKNVDAVYVTIDLDGFSSAYAPGVSAPSPMGFTPDVVLESLKTISSTGKLCALDIAEMNPDFDVDSQTARLAASLVHHVIHSI